MTVHIHADGVLIDRDGVLNHAKDGHVIEGAVPWLMRLQEQEIPFLIATNHTTSSPEEAAEELRAAGFAVDTEAVHTPLSMLAGLLEEAGIRSAYVRGTFELVRYIESFQVRVSDRPDVDAVILGFDRTMDYSALSTAITAVMDYGARLIALHENRIFRDVLQRIEPGLGAWVRAIEFASGVKGMILGKPSCDYYLAALAKLRLSARDVVMISDDPLGDLQGAADVNIRTVFVTSGKYRDRGVLASPEIRCQPDWVVDTINDIRIVR